MIHLCRDVFTALLHNNEGGADQRMLRPSIVASVHFRRNVFAEPLPNNELFLLSGVMSHYDSYKAGADRS
jgi:hypothetical protein